MKDRVFAWIQQYQMIQSGDRIIAGISGGADSVCLFSILLEYQKQVDFELAAVHVNHGLRGEEAKRDERFVEMLCREAQIAYYPYHYDVNALAKEGHFSTEEAGRKARYEAFAHCMKQWNGNKVALAHHQDDQAETVLYHLFRGSGLTGLCGIRPVRDEIIRPLLCISRQEIEQYLKERHLSYVTDSSNHSLCYARNRIRHEILPSAREQINEQSSRHVAQAAMDLQEAEWYLQEQAKLLFDRFVNANEEGLVIGQELFGQPRIMVNYVLRLCLQSLTGLRDVTRDHIFAIAELAKKEVGKECSLPRNARAVRGYQEIYLIKEGEKIPFFDDIITPQQVKTKIFPYESQQIPEKKYTKWFDYDKMKGTMVVRYRQPGDYLTVTADGGRKKLKDYLIDQKIPQKERDSLLLVAEGSHILWVIGYRISEAYKITKKTKQVLEVRIEGGRTHE